MTARPLLGLAPSAHTLAEIVTESDNSASSPRLGFWQNVERLNPRGPT
jgi:hypothetical protein